MVTAYAFYSNKVTILDPAPFKKVCAKFVHDAEIKKITRYQKFKEIKR